MDITSATNVNPAAETVTLPLFQGAHNGQAVYYVVTDDSSKSDAAARGVNWSPKLANALGTAAVQNASTAGGVVQFPGIVDFSPTRVVTPGPPGNEFPGGSFTPGADGDARYSPLITTGNGIVLNATQISDDSGTHDSVVSIDTVHHTVTLKSFFGFWNGHRTLYLHLDASAPAVAAAEGSNYAPNLDASPGEGSDDPNTSARDAIIPVINGQTGVANPDRQGLNSALRGEGDPLNVQQEIPGQGNGRYSPIWDVHPLTWTQAAINTGQRVLLTSGSASPTRSPTDWPPAGPARRTAASAACPPAGSSPTAPSSPSANPPHSSRGGDPARVTAAIMRAYRSFTPSIRLAISSSE